MWKLFLGEIPLLAAVVITIIVFGCFSNSFGIYGLLSIVKICIYHEFGWFMKINQKHLSRIIVLFTLTWFLTKESRSHYLNFMQRKYHGLALFLAFSKYCEQKQVMMSVSYYPAVIMFCLLSFLIECYISVKIKRLPLSSLKTGTIGHIMMTSTLILVSTNVENFAFYGVKAPFTFFVFQVLYLLKYRDYACHFIKELCSCNRNTVEPEHYQISLNEFGIFVGNNDALSTEQTNKTLNEDFEGSQNNKFGGVYVGSE